MLHKWNWFGIRRSGRLWYRTKNVHTFLSFSDWYTCQPHSNLLVFIIVATLGHLDIHICNSVMALKLRGIQRVLLLTDFTFLTVVPHQLFYSNEPVAKPWLLFPIP
jgi:hypothetical protein